MLCFAVKKSQDPCSVGILLIVSFTTALHQGHDLRVLLNTFDFVCNSNFFLFDLAFAFGLCCKHLQTFH